MPILGINGLNGTYHDSGACLVTDDGEWVAVEEERLNRIKHSSGFPARAIEWCLAEAGIEAAELDAVGFFLDTEAHYARYFLKTVYDNPGAADEFFLYSYKIFRYWKDALLPEMASWLSLPRERIVPVPHHLAHAASAFYPSPFEEAAVLSVDGAGDADTACYAVGRGTRVERIALPLVYPASIGMLYNFVAAHLGLGQTGGAGKLMGLAPYGKPAFIEELRRVVSIPSAADAGAVIRFDSDYFSYHLGGDHPALTPLFHDRFGPPRSSMEPIRSEHADLAASMQLLLEEVIVFLAKQLRAMTGLRRLCYAGGVALNIDANSRIREECGFDEIFIMPSAYDAGTSIGAALYLHHLGFQRPRVAPLPNAFKGPRFDDGEIELALRGAGLAFERVEDPAAAAAALLAGGAIVGWFQGREEIGPRALGNRSILLDPGIPSGKDHINQRVKFREAYRPFAPSVPLDDAALYFESPCPSPFMLYKFPVRREWRERLPAVTHVDGSARVHTVTREENPLFFGLLKRFGEHKGYSVLLNTSFNVRGQPLVSRPGQAIELFRQGALDALVIGGFVVERRGGEPRTKKIAAADLPSGVVDPGGAPSFPLFEEPPAPAPYPEGIALDGDEKEVLRRELEELRRRATGPEGRLVREVAALLERLERSPRLQQLLGAESLPTLWRAFSRLWSGDSDLPAATARDLYLRGEKKFPRGPEPRSGESPDLAPGDAASGAPS